MRAQLYNYSSITTPIQVKTGLLNESGENDAKYLYFQTCPTYACLNDILKTSNI